MNPHTLALVLLAGTVATAEPQLSIILDTDMGGDCDDVGALYILHGAVERGEAKLLATMGCTSNPYIAPCLDAINTWFGRPDIPVGTLKDPGVSAGVGYCEAVARRFPHRSATGADYPDAVALYRKILVQQPDRSVTVLAIGPLRNLANLLKSPADATSPLDGKALIAKKVKILGVMGGKYPPFASKHDKDGEANFISDGPSTAAVCATWPTPVLWNGEGGNTCSGRRVTYEMPEHNPLSLAYALYPDVGFAADRLSWDPITCLVAVRGPAPWFTLGGGGVNSADPATGINRWQDGPDRGHTYLINDAKKPKRLLEDALEDLMVAGRGHPSALVWDTLTYARAGMVRTTCSGSRPMKKNWLTAGIDWQDAAASSWLEFQHADSRRYLVTSYALTCPDLGRLAATVELSGSNDGGATWTRLDSRKALAFTEQAKRLEFPVAKPAKWNGYRLVVTPAVPENGFFISTVELNETITCTPKVAVARLALDQQSLILPADGRATLNATLTPLNSYERQVTWTSSDPAVAEVRRIGEQIAIVAAKKPGTCTITATSDTAKQVCTVTIKPTTLPPGWRYDEINTPPIPGSAIWTKDALTLTGCGDNMTSWWARNYDQGAFTSSAAVGACELTARLVALGPDRGSPGSSVAHRSPSHAGLMIREALVQPRGRYALIQVEADGAVTCRWRSTTDDANDNQYKAIPVQGSLPLPLRLAKTATQVRLYTSPDGTTWGEPALTLDAAFDDTSRIGMFTCSGNTVATTIATFEGIKLTK